MENAFNIVWFKRDLRVADHGALATAMAAGPTIALYCVEPDYWSGDDVSKRQWEFTAECLAELRDDLAGLNVPLLAIPKNAPQAMALLLQALPVEAVYSHEETGNAWTFKRDLSVKDVLRHKQIAWFETRQHGVIRGLSQRYDWAGQWERLMRQPLIAIPGAQAPFALPSAIEQFAAGLPVPLLADDRCPGRQVGGRREALSLLGSFLRERGRTYRRAMSSPLYGEDTCSRLSPHLAQGTLAVREAFTAARARLEELDKGVPHEKELGQSIVSFMSRLHWHCHFIQKLETRPEIEWAEMHSAYRGLRPLEADPALLEAWIEGQTGLPFVDACMRFLKHTGWLNFRMRAMVMAFASYHLWQPWQVSGKLLARRFTDYEPGIHWAQSQMQSGVTGINTVRIYNPVKQGYDQDPDGVFIRRWVPELAQLEGKALHEPWKHAADLLMPIDYPAPIVDHLEAARVAKRKIFTARGAPGFRKEAWDVVKELSSRKTPNQPDMRRRKAEKARSSTDEAQGNFGF